PPILGSNEEAVWSKTSSYHALHADRPPWLVSSGHETTAPEQKWSEFLLRVIRTSYRGVRASTYPEQRGRSPKATARKPVRRVILTEDPVC
ncbi:MAG: hypothetical protein AN484_28175, partial [Aphanizomenon flos-aquae WA102]